MDNRFRGSQLGARGLASPTMITSRVRRWHRLPRLLVLPVLLLAGCSTASAHGSVLAKPSSSLRVPPTSGVTPSLIATPTSTAAVEAGVRDWFAAVNVAFTTGDTKGLREHTDKECRCLNLVRKIEAAWAKGQIHDLAWSVEDVHVVYIRGDDATVQLTFSEPAYYVVTSGRRSGTHQADRITVMSRFALKAGEWRLWSYLQQSVESR